MDINANPLPMPTAAPTPVAKNTDLQQKSSHLDENQVPALPFQAVLDNQQAAPKEAPTSPSIDENTLNKSIVTQKISEATDTGIQGEAVVKESAESTIDQLNFSRGLRPDGTQTALQSNLLTGKEAVESTWIEKLKQSSTPPLQLNSDKNTSTEKQLILNGFSQKSTQPNGEQHIIAEDEGLVPSLLKQTDEEEAPALEPFIKNEKEERRDQPLFALNNQRDNRTKVLTQDFMPLNKKVDNNKPELNFQALAAENSSNMAKSAFTAQSETGAFTASQTNPSSTHTISMMPTVSTTQAATMNAPVAQPTMHLNSQLGSEAWQQQLSQHMLFFSRQGVSQAQIRLHPEELGSLNVHLRIEDNQAVLHFASPHSHVRAVMESMMPVLRNALQESGIHLAQSSVGQDNLSNSSGSGQQGSGRHDVHINDSQSSIGIAGVSESDTHVLAKNVASRQGGINTFA